MTFINWLLAEINSIPSYAWEVIIETAFGAVTASALALGFKKWWSIDSEKKMIMTVALMSLLVGAAMYLRGVPKFAPWYALVQGWVIFATSQPAWFFFVKPFFAKMSVWLTDQIAKAAVVNEAQNAAIPAEGLPLTNNADNVLG